MARDNERVLRVIAALTSVVALVIAGMLLERQRWPEAAAVILAGGITQLMVAIDREGA